MEKVIHKYLEGLEKADAESILSLFAENAVVHSPLYGKMTAVDFYKGLFDDSNASVIHCHSIFTNTTKNAANVFFTYEWTMANGKRSTFDCVDIFNFDTNGLITEMRIIYDTAKTRPLFDELVIAKK